MASGLAGGGLKNFGRFRRRWPQADWMIYISILLHKYLNQSFNLGTISSTRPKFAVLRFHVFWNTDSMDSIFLSIRSVLRPRVSVQRPELRISDMRSMKLFRMDQFTRFKKSAYEQVPVTQVNKTQLK